MASKDRAACGGDLIVYEGDDVHVVCGELILIDTYGEDVKTAGVVSREIDLDDVDAKAAMEAVPTQPSVQKRTAHGYHLLNTSFRYTIKGFVIYSGARALAPVLFNSAWVSAANIAGCGNGLQSFWTFMFEYDMYFVTLKAVMVSLFFWTFMPTPAPNKPVYTPVLHALQVFLQVFFNSCMGLLWWGLGLTDDGTLTWLLFKLNFPLGVSVGLVSFMPIYLMVNWRREGRLFAFKRYVLLVVVLVFDVILIGGSLAYIWAFKYVNAHILPGRIWVERQAIQALSIVMFTMGFMPLLGRIWWVGIRLMKTIAPMDDLQGQRFIFFATVIADVHRLLYCRKLFVNLSALWIFFVFLIKDFVYLLYQFGIKSMPQYQVGHFKIFHRESLNLQMSGIEKAITTVVRLGASIMECPKSLMAWCTIPVECGFGGQADILVQDVNYFFADFRITLKNLPDISGGKLAELEHMTPQQRRDQIEQLLSGVLQDKVSKQATQSSTDFSTWDVFVTSATAQNMFDDPKRDMPSTKMNPFAKSMNRSLSKKWQCEFFNYLSLRVNSIIFMRAQARFTIAMSTALTHVFMGLVIRSTSAKDVLNFIDDHHKSVGANVMLVSICFVLFDLLSMAVLLPMHLKDPHTRHLHMVRFGRLFESKPFAAVILLCTICCNSDFFLTFPVMHFCK